MRGDGFRGAAALGAGFLAAIAAGYAYVGAHGVRTTYAYVTAPYEWQSAPTAGIVKRVEVAAGHRVADGRPVAVIETGDGHDVILRSVAAGTVGGLAVFAGDYVVPGQRLWPVVLTRAAEIVAVFPEDTVSRVAVGDPAKVRLTAYPGIVFAGRVARVGAAALSRTSPIVRAGDVAPATQWVPVVVSVHADGRVLRPGESASVTVGQ